MTNLFIAFHPDNYRDRIVWEPAYLNNFWNYSKKTFPDFHFLDILYKLEKLNLLESAKDWITLRQTRNTVSHEYPFYKEIQVEELNLLPEDVVKLAVLWVKLKDYALKRLSI